MQSYLGTGFGSSRDVLSTYLSICISNIETCQVLRKKKKNTNNKIHFFLIIIFESKIQANL